MTGASRGIGAAVAERLAAEGADVVITARTAEPDERIPGSLGEVRARLSSYGTNVGVVVADLADPTDRRRVVPEAVELLGGPVDILVSNAAAAIYAEPSTFSEKRRRILFEVNVHAPVDLAHAVVPSMRAAGEGWIVHLTSAAAAHVAGPPFEMGPQGAMIAMYGASKAALDRFSNGLASELWGTGVRVNAVRPRAAVLSEGAAALVGATLRADQVEAMEQMVEAVVALCDCPETTTGRSAVSLDLVDELGLKVRGLDGQEWERR